MVIMGCTNSMAFPVTFNQSGGGQWLEQPSKAKQCHRLRLVQSPAGNSSVTQPYWRRKKAEKELLPALGMRKTRTG